VKASGNVAKALASTLMDAIVLADGRALGNLRWRDIDTAVERELEASRSFMGRSGERARCALVLQRIKGLVANAQPSQKIRDVIGLPLLETTWKATEDKTTKAA
jgi:hypothetical protein